MRNTLTWILVVVALAGLLVAAAGALHRHAARCPGGHFELIGQAPRCVGAAPRAVERWSN